MATPESESSSPAPDRRDQELLHVRDALRGLRYGSITVIVQDGVIVQIDRTDKRRYRRANPNTPGDTDCR
jgi:hypothetical protein